MFARFTDKVTFVAVESNLYVERTTALPMMVPSHYTLSRYRPFLQEYVESLECSLGLDKISPRSLKVPMHARIQYWRILSISYGFPCILRFYDVAPKNLAYACRSAHVAFFRLSSF